MRSMLHSRTVLTLSATNGWAVITADVKAAFLKTGDASRDVYVRPSREFKDRRHYWLLLAAAYGFDESNFKFQTQADVALFSLCLSCVTVATQLFQLKSDGELILLATEDFDEFPIISLTSYVDKFLVELNKRFQFVSAVRDSDILKPFWYECGSK